MIMLKKGVVILIISIFLFNLAGYRLLFNIAGHRADEAIRDRLEQENFQEHELIVFKQPLSIPYYSGTSGFEPASGELAAGGMIYRYVKKRVVNDTLEMYCLPHHEKARVFNARDEFMKLAADFSHARVPDQKAPVRSAVKPFSFDSDVPGMQEVQWLEEQPCTFSLYVLPGRGEPYMQAIPQPPDAAPLT
jgi:hypothetical protein